MKTKLLEQAKREYSPNKRLIALLVEAVFFVILIPFLLISIGSTLDQWLRWSHLVYQPANLLLGSFLIVSGWLFAMWSIYVQFTIGRGTPVPMMATQKLIIQPPYLYSRNPMALGSFVMYGGVAVLIGSPGAGVLVGLWISGLVIYIKRVEEKEMELRFGDEYLEYKRRTPFLIPHGRRPVP